MKLLESTIHQISPLDTEYSKKAKSHLEKLTMPYWALGRLMDLAEALAGMTGTLTPSVKRKTIVTMAADHGVVCESVSKYPQEVTPQMIHNFVRGGAGINVLAKQANARVIVVDMGVKGDLSALVQENKIISKRIAPGTQNIAIGPAMTPDQAVRSIEAGIEVVHSIQNGFDIIGTGDMGIGNTTPSAAIAAVITDKPVSAVTGRGTGIDDEQLRHKISVIEKSIEANKPDPKDPLDILSKVGGFEIGGIAGLILGASALQKPVIIDGFISTSAALIAKLLCPDSMDFVIASHQSVELGHQIMLEYLDKKPLLDLDLRLGEGTGAALAMNLVEAAVGILTEVATFDEAEVSKEIE